MATSVRPFLLSGAALASAAALTVAAPAAMPGVPTPLPLSAAQYELTALSDVSIQGVAEAFTAGWGGFIGPADVFYPGEFANDVLLSGINGVAYYVADQGLDGIVPFNLENYFFEVGSRSPGNELFAGLGAAAYVGAGSVFGVDSAPAQFVKTLFGGGSVDVGTAIVTLTAGIPVVGDLTSVYFTGQVAGDETDYGSGLAGVFAYVTTLLPGLAGVDFAGLVTGVAGLIGTIGNLIDGSSGNGNGNGNGGSQSDDEDDADSEDASDDDSEDASDEDSEDSEDDSDDAESKGGKGSNRPNPGAAVLAKPAAAAVTVAVKTAEVADGGAGTEAPEPVQPSADAPETESTPSADGAPSAPKRGAERGAGRSAAKAGADEHGNDAKAGRTAR